MKNAFFLLIVILAMASCAKQSTVNEPADKFNGYEKFLKTGEVTYNLYAGRTILVGTVTYGIDNNANFYAKYDCTTSGWTISETHMYAGDKKYMPLNKPGNPKIGQFPNSRCHNPRVSNYTYYVPLTTLPPCAEPGFVVASHCVVRSPSGQTETAWAWGQFKFTDKDWGWYNIYFYNQPPNEFTILYGTAYVNDTLKLYHLDVTNGTSQMILKEFVGSNAGRLDGAAYDNESGNFFFANYNTGELYINNLKDELPSFSAGVLNGVSASGTFFNDAYYYVNEEASTINKVTFNTNWAISGEILLDTIPSSITVNDITMSPDGETMYMLGELNGGGKELISWDVSEETFYSMSITITSGAQIAYGSDGVLYVIAPIIEGGSHSLTYSVDPGTGTLTPIDDDVIIIVDPFSDISAGPIM
jgi:hypothetical protein